ncbi:Uncharacterized protein FWK35_00008334, partial [Aphis craccivora]
IKKNYNLLLLLQSENSRVWCLTATTADLLLALCTSQESWRFMVDFRRGYPAKRSVPCCG